MANIRQVLVLTGARTGFTGVFGNHRFVDGRTVVRGDEKSVMGTIRYLGRTYKAFPEFSEELHQARSQDAKNKSLSDDQRKEASDGLGEVHPQVSTARPEGPDGSGVQAHVAGTPSEGSSDGGADDDTHTGPAGSGSGGDRHERSGQHGSEGQSQRIREAVMAFSSTDPEKWTTEGKPRIDAVETATGLSGVTRALVNQATDGYRRP